MNKISKHDVDKIIGRCNPRQWMEYSNAKIAHHRLTEFMQPNPDSLTFWVRRLSYVKYPVAERS